MMAQTGAPGAPRERDRRLDFFRGLAMFIILIAHVPDNPWTLWIPARFGFSDATEIFVFCSGMASAYAFGGVFLTGGPFLGTMRIAFRVWQVYWAHVGVFLVSATILVAIDINGWGAEDVRYVARTFVVPFFERTGETLIGLLTLRYVPGLFDILPMYLVILALIPGVMLAHGRGGAWAVAAVVAGLYLLASLAGHPLIMEGRAPWVGGAAMALAESLSFLNPPALPGGDAVWFFNPFAWQLIFFTGFAFGMGWLPAPPRSRRLARAAAVLLLLSVPLAWFRLYEPWSMAPGSWLGAAQAVLAPLRESLEPLTTKTWFGALRYGHFLLLAYLAWYLVGERGERLSRPLDIGETPTRRRRALLAAAGVVVILTAPYGHIRVIADHLPALERWLLAHWLLFPDGRLGVAQLLNYAATVVFLWHLPGPRARAWLLGPGWAAAVQVIGKVGTQSLAVFMTSIPLAICCGLVLDLWGRGAGAVAIVNLSGFAILIATAYFCSWIKGHPWRRPMQTRTAPTAVPTPAE
jgi:hypothetical protein